MADEQSAGAVSKTAGKTGQFFSKHKTTIFAVGGIVVVFVLYLVLRGNSSTSAATGADTDAADNGTTGFSPTDSGNVGPTGPAGATGSTGATGPAGKTNWYQMAKQLLISRGNKNPSVAQIDRERKKLLKELGGGGGKNTPNTPKGAALTPITALTTHTTHYTVKPGDTLASIGAKHGVDSSDIHAMNRTQLGNKGVMAGHAGFMGIEN